MKNTLDVFESKLKRLIEGIPNILGFDKPEDLSHKVRLALQETVEGLAAGKTAAIGNFILRIHPETYQELANPQDLLDSLSQVIQLAAEEENITFLGKPAIHVETDQSIQKDNIQVEVDTLVDTHGYTAAVSLTPAPPPANGIPHEAYLIIEGKETYILNLPVINIGRREDNHLVIEDLRISRTHAQLRARMGKYVIFDLGSTGGTFVNGLRITQAVLAPGDVISLAGLTLIYSETCADPSDNTDRMPKL
jgi:hypothetical protein